jgi:hypothetical protein
LILLKIGGHKTWKIVVIRTQREIPNPFRDIGDIYGDSMEKHLEKWRPRNRNSYGDTFEDMKTSFRASSVRTIGVALL